MPMLLPLPRRVFYLALVIIGVLAFLSHVFDAGPSIAGVYESTLKWGPPDPAPKVDTPPRVPPGDSDATEGEHPLDDHPPNPPQLTGPSTPAHASEPNSESQPEPVTDYILDSMAETSIPKGAHVHGFTVFDNLYLRGGTFYVLTSDVDAFPPRRNLIAKPLESGRGNDHEPSDNELTFLDPRNAESVLGAYATPMKGVSIVLYDPAEFMHHLYHWWGEIILGLWRVYSLLGTSEAPPPFPTRFLLPAISNDEWRDSAGVDGPLMRAAFPHASIEQSDQWQDLIRLNTTVVFERAMVVTREAAHRHPFGGVWFKMIAGTMSLPARDDFWAPVQQSLVRGVLGFLPVLDDRGLVASPPHAATSKPVVTYISRQGAGRRLRDGDHAGLVAALEEMEREGVLELNVVMMELLGLKEQIGVAAKSTIILGVHGNGLTHQLWMPPSKRSAVFEMFYPKSYVFDYEMLARNMGHRHYAVWNDTLITYPKGTTHQDINYGDNFNGNDMPVYGPAVARVIRERLTGPLEP